MLQSSPFQNIQIPVQLKLFLQQYNLEVQPKHQNMFNQLQNYYDSVYFYHLVANTPYFNYDPFINTFKISPNIILTDNEGRALDKTLSEQNIQEAKIDQYKVQKVQKVQNVQVIKKQKIKDKIKQVSVNKAKKIKKLAKKVEIVQKQGRNSHSNVLRKFFKFLSQRNQFEPIIEKIIQKYSFDISRENFFKQVKEKNIDHRNYIRVKQVKWIFEVNKNPINKITRILFENYLQNFYIGHILSSKKTGDRSIAFHLKVRRTIGEQILSKNSLQEEQYQNQER